MNIVLRSDLGKKILRCLLTVGDCAFRWTRITGDIKTEPCVFPDIHKNLKLLNRMLINGLSETISLIQFKVKVQHDIVCEDIIHE